MIHSAFDASHVTSPRSRKNSCDSRWLRNSLSSPPVTMLGPTALAGRASVLRQRPRSSNAKRRESDSIASAIDARGLVGELDVAMKGPPGGSDRRRRGRADEPFAVEPAEGEADAGDAVDDTDDAGRFLRFEPMAGLRNKMSAFRNAVKVAGCDGSSARSGGRAGAQGNRSSADRNEEALRCGR